ncbi:MAG: pyridoxamine 5'-phosphate oxidase family protein [Pseudomonadota bacterium]
MKDHHHELKDEFWDRLEDISAGMLSTLAAPARPMAHIVRDDDEGLLWFITAKGTDIAEAAAQGSAATHMVACPKGKLFATVEGTLSGVDDAKVLDDIWSPTAAAWFEDGREDEAICLVKFTPRTAEVWLTDGSAKFLYEVAKANLTDGTPDVGAHGTLTF